MSPSPPKSKTLPLAIISGLAVIGGMAYMVTSSVSDGSALEYFKDVDQALIQPKKWLDKRLRLRGNIVEGTIQKKKDSLTYRFAMYSKDRWVEVTYHGLVPDTFKDCAEVVVKGKLLDPGHFKADEITAKCPSKYSAEERRSGCGEAIRPKVLAARAATKHTSGS
ncbi:MAG: cytochrome c maturation protein CcmE [Deltaproteobacteria bacterium]|nr:cytochrome c maturation protein CcmE [Deltaproteobacteria bacterium]